MKSKYIYGQDVQFHFDDQIKSGYIYIVDYWGDQGFTYDIYSLSENMLYKHVPEKDII